jgi:drug/metabolite transporter (DMT)-like permease
MNTASGSPRRLNGLYIAGATALISGVSVFVSSYGVHDFSSPALYTTAKNLVATIVLIAGVLVFATIGRASSSVPQPISQRDTTQRARILRTVGYLYVGVVGGGVAFVLFFDGLARTAATPAAFLHDTLVIFVGVLAWPALKERVSVFNCVAIGLLVIGAVAISGGVGHLSFGGGPHLVLGATVLWAIETVIAKTLLNGTSPSRLALIRMGVGALVLIGDLAITGHLAGLASLDRAQFGWALITGLLLAAYVATWFTALARARAIDVTSVLVASVAVTSLLQATAGHAVSAPAYVGVGLIAAGIVALASRRPKRVLA